MDTNDRLRRWRLILGSEAQKRMEGMGDGPDLSQEDFMMDTALDAIYNRDMKFGFGGGAGKGASSPQISRWLGDVRTLFDKDIVKIIQSDAMERCGLKQLIFEPELLENIEPDMHMASMILTLKDQIPKQSKENAREFIRKIVEQINALLETDLKRAVTASINRKLHSPIPSASALDFQTTIRKGIKDYNTKLKKIIPQKYYFFERSATTAANKYTVILDIDQSGSMGESVIYSSIMSCILASMSAIKTKVVAFDTNIVDLSEKCEDPIDLLFGFTLGGGTDIEKSIKYCTKYIENPKKTIFFLISDLEEGGNRAGLLRRLTQMKEDGVIVICLLAISDSGKPYYDANMAQRIANNGIPCFAAAPQMLPRLLEKAMKNEDMSEFTTGKFGVEK
ncbi:VWA domain-containing protein [Lachnoanaerobaculum orale]|uniref:VWA domain-containing protein n=1 Tax=Lachnoanaerobaculum orale TaxID=979627 RepID=A0A3P3Q4R9_9FIRM|nr:VWA domain-containing protein [Lachnoanaerobaculum orale]RRJ16018.1 VWA domain-containing protein [Lachnoanaerobaculum orale]